MSSRCYCVSGKSWRICFSQVALTTPIVPASTRSATHLTIQTAPSVTTTTVLQVNIIITSSIIIITFNMTHSQMLGKFEYTKGPIFKVVLEC